MITRVLLFGEEGEGEQGPNTCSYVYNNHLTINCDEGRSRNPEASQISITLDHTPKLSVTGCRVISGDETTPCH